MCFGYKGAIVSWLLATISAHTFVQSHPFFSTAIAGEVLQAQSVSLCWLFQDKFIIPDPIVDNTSIGIKAGRQSYTVQGAQSRHSKSIQSGKGKVATEWSSRQKWELAVEIISLWEEQVIQLTYSQLLRVDKAT